MTGNSAETESQAAIAALLAVFRPSQLRRIAIWTKEALLTGYGSVTITIERGRVRFIGGTRSYDELGGEVGEKGK
jgi:hypothetical protein